MQMLKIIYVIGAAYLLFVAFVYLMQGRMLYLPNIAGRSLVMTPADADMEYDDVTLVTDDGVRVHGWFVAGESDQVVLFFHGNAGNISHRLDSVRQFLDLGLSVFIIDYRGYGESEGKPSEAGINRDADAAWRYLTETRQIPPEHIVIFGRSLGASVAARVAALRNPRGLIVESSFTSVPDIAQELYPWLPARWLSRLRHATRDHVRDVRCPVLVVHSRDDEIIPYHHGETIYATAREPRTLLTLRGSHNDAFLRDSRNYSSGLEQFLSSLNQEARP